MSKQDVVFRLFGFERAADEFKQAVMELEADKAQVHGAGGRFVSGGGAVATPPAPKPLPKPEPVPTGRTRGTGGRFLPKTPKEPTGGGGGVGTIATPKPAPKPKPEPTPAGAGRARGTGGKFLPRDKKPAEVAKPAETPKPAADGPVVYTAHPLEHWQKFHTVGMVSMALESKFPRTKFDLKGMSIEAAQRSAAEIDKLMSQYHNVGQTVSYIGTGLKDGKYAASKNYVNAMAKTTNGQITMAGLAYHAESRIFLNTATFASAGYADARVRGMENSGWSPKGVHGLEFVIAHEFGHAIHNYLQRNGSLGSMFSWGSTAGGKGTVRELTQQFLHQTHSLGETVSGYAKSSGLANRYTGEAEHFAEAFAQFHQVPASQHSEFTQRFGGFLNAVLPGGSPHHWNKAPGLPFGNAPFNDAQQKEYYDWVVKYFYGK